MQPKDELEYEPKTPVICEDCPTSKDDPNEFLLDHDELGEDNTHEYK